MVSLIVFCTVYAFIFGISISSKFLRAGPPESLVLPPIGAVPNRPMSVVHSDLTGPRQLPAGE